MHASASERICRIAEQRAAATTFLVNSTQGRRCLLLSRVRPAIVKEVLLVLSAGR